MPTRLPIVDVADIAAKRRPEKDLSILEARNARRLIVTPDPRVIIEKPATSAEMLGDTATIVDPMQRSMALPDEIDKSRINGLILRNLEVNELANGNRTK